MLIFKLNSIVLYSWVPIYTNFNHEIWVLNSGVNNDFFNKKKKLYYGSLNF